jgi:hypothetical protein
MGDYQSEKGKTMKKKLLVLVILFLTASLSYAQDKRHEVPVGDSPGYGQANAPVTMIEFIDYQ